MLEFKFTDKQRQVRDFVHEFARSVVRPMSLEADRAHRIPDAFLLKLAALGAAMPGAIGVDAAGGDPDPPRKGPGQTNRTLLVAAEELAWGDASVFLNIPGPGLGGPPVRFMGTPEQRDRFFGVFQKAGLHYGAYGLTEPGAGSDVSGIQTTCRKAGRDWILDGVKCFITNGARADWVVVFATVDRAQGRSGHRAFVVERGTPGFSVGKIEEKMGLRASETAELVLEDCRVPGDNLLGGEGHYASRPMVGIMAVGIARAAWEHARDFVKDAYVTARPIPRYAALAARLAEDERLIDAARLMCWRAAWMADEGLPNAMEASMAKAYAARVAMKVCADAVQILGAHGLEDHQLVEKWYRDIKVFDIFEGTAQIQRIVVARRLLRETPRW